MTNDVKLLSIWIRPSLQFPYLIFCQAPCGALESSEHPCSIVYFFPSPSVLRSQHHWSGATQNNTFDAATMDASQDFKSLQEKIQSSLVATTRTVNGLANEDLSFQRTVNPSTSARLDATSERLLRLAGDVLKSAGKFTGQTVPSIEDADDVDISWKGILDVVDSLLEKTDTCLDEYTGLVKRKDVPAAESVSLTSDSTRILGRDTVLTTARAPRLRGRKRTTG